MIELVRETYRYRELIWALALKELKIRYKRSVLGFLWALLNPALLMLVLTLVFSKIMRFPYRTTPFFCLAFCCPGRSSRNRSLTLWSRSLATAI